VLIESRSKLKGEVTVPGDKSISFRAIVFGALASGTTEIDNILLSEDCISAIDCFRKMQVSVEIQQQNRVKVHGKGIYGLQAPSSALNAGRSGTALRLLLGVLCGQTFNSTLVRNDSCHEKACRQGSRLPETNGSGYFRKGRLQPVSAFHIPRCS
jgi:3-phosphoshikimate 1-carboxyvinyltransferase